MNKMFYIPYDKNITYAVILREPTTGNVERIRRFKNYYRMLEYTDWVDKHLSHLDVQILMKEKGKGTVDITLGVYS